MRVSLKELEAIQRCPVCKAPLVRLVSKYFVCPNGLDHTRLITLEPGVAYRHKRAIKALKWMEASEISHKREKPRRPERYLVDYREGLFVRCRKTETGAFAVRVKNGKYWSLFFVKQDGKQ